jgi:hypothetical protein
MRTSPSSAVYRTRANSSDLHDVATNGVKCSWVRKSMSRTPLRTSQELLHHYHEPHAYLCILRMCSYPFWAYTKQSWHSNSSTSQYVAWPFGDTMIFRYDHYVNRGCEILSRVPRHLYDH